MGQDKALLGLAGKPLVQLAVEKLRRVCAEVHILGNRPELGAYAPVIPDRHAECGPLGGIEAALLHSTRSWNLFMAVDMPFLPVGFLDGWVRRVVGCERARVALFTVDGMPQPALCLVHREIAPFVNRAMERGEFKLFPVLAEGARELATQQQVSLDEVLLNLPWNEDVLDDIEWTPTEVQRRALSLWFANLNTPEEFVAAKAFTGLLDTD